MKYSLLFALFCINVSNGVFGWASGCFQGAFRVCPPNACTKGTDTRDLAKGKSFDDRLAEAEHRLRVGFYSYANPDLRVPAHIMVNTLGALGQFQRVQEMYNDIGVINGRQIPIIEVVPGSHKIFLINQYPFCVILFTRGDEYFACSVQAKQDAISSKDTYKAIWAFADSLLPLFLDNSLKLSSIISNANRIMPHNPNLNFDLFTGFGYKDCPWLDHFFDFDNHENSLLGFHYRLRQCLDGCEGRNALFYRLQHGENHTAFCSFNFNDRPNGIVIKLTFKNDDYNDWLSPEGSEKSLFSLIEKPYEPCNSIEIAVNEADENEYIGVKWVPEITIPSPADEDQDHSKTIGHILIKMTERLGRPMSEIAPQGVVLTQVLNGFYPTSFVYPPNSDG
jgi:hypothetical protein